MRYDAVIVGGGHNGLVAAAYLARAGRSVLVLERRDHVGGAAVSERPWEGVDARLSRYAYLVSLLPRHIAAELGVGVELRRRAVSSYTPRPDGGGLLVRAGEPPSAAWRDFSALTRRVAARVFPTLTGPLPSREQMRAIVDDDAAWEALFERPLGETVAERFPDDLERGVVLTDGLIGTFAGAGDASLRQNRCFLYHVIGNGTGDWDVPVGGMGAVTAALADAAETAGAELRCGVEVTEVVTDGMSAEVRWDGGRAARGHVLSNVAPALLARLLGEPAPERAPEGAQLKVNMLLARLPRLRDGAVHPREAFAGTFHVNEAAGQLAAAHARASAGALPDPVPCEVVLPHARRPHDPRRRPAGRRRPHADVLRAAHAGPALPSRPRGGEGGRGGGHAALARLRAGRADRGLPAGARPPASRASRRTRRSSSRPSWACRAATSSTATWRGRSPRTTPR